MADDAINRRLAIQLASPSLNEVNLVYLKDDDVRLVSDHDQRCFNGADADLKKRFITRWISNSTPPANPSIAYLSVPRPGELPYSNEQDMTGTAGPRARRSSASRGRT